MIDREKSVNDLNLSKFILCNPQMLTPEMCVRIGQVITNAIDLLKRQEPRLITKEDFKDADEWGYLPVWCETVEGQMYCECITVTALDIEQSLYRYWTRKPTEKQRKEMRWVD